MTNKSKLPKIFIFFQKNCHWQFYLKKCQIFGNFLPVKWQFSGGSSAYCVPPQVCHPGGTFDTSYLKLFHTVDSIRFSTISPLLHYRDVTFVSTVGQIDTKCHFLTSDLSTLWLCEFLRSDLSILWLAETKYMEI